MASSQTTEGSTVEVMLLISGVVIGFVLLAGTFAPELLPWVNELVNDLAEQLGLNF